jgi:hypothetical protein
MKERVGNDERDSGEPGGDAACWLHLVCEECGAVVTARDGHRAGCSLLPTPDRAPEPHS